MNTAIQSIRRFLLAQKPRHANPQLLDKIDPTCMEVQVNVHGAGGEPVAGKRSTYADSAGNEWFSFRIPKDARDNPHFKDFPLKWPLDLHALCVGSTGWNWKDRCSYWVGFDFDSIVGHAKGIADIRLEEVKAAASNLPYVQVQHSTGGTGLHLYVTLDSIPSANHNEHAALGRTVLAKMSAEVGFDFQAAVDVCGGNLWVWHRNAARHGYGFIKTATATLAECDLPGWRSHLDVIRRRSPRIIIPGVTDCDVFDELATAYPRFPLDEDHKRHIEQMAATGFSTVWVQDHHLLQCHTAGFAKLYEAGGIKGVYQTSSQGTDPSTPNCFGYPLPRGGWHLFRFGPGTAEAPTWEQDGKGWTRCKFNVAPDLKTLARFHGAAEMPRGGGWQLKGKDAAELTKQLGGTVDLPEHLHHRLIVARGNHDGRLILECPVEKSDPSLSGWGQNKGKAFKLFDVPTSQPEEQAENGVVRILVTPTNENAGCFINSVDGTWDLHSVSTAKMVLQNFGHPKPEAEQIIGHATRNRWTLVTQPFAPEYPGNRQWNRGAPQWRYAPADVDDPLHPTWDAVLQHLGRGFDEAVKASQWCREHDILTGADWWRLWYALILRDPACKLPYVFLWGEGNAGKSTVYESFQELVTCGVQDAKRALTNREGFNGELENCVLAYIDEYDLTKDHYAATRIKEWSTCREVSIRKMRSNVYQVPSYLHFVHLANDAGFVEILPDDVRIMVGTITKPDKELKKETELRPRLRQEAPHFMRTLVDLRLPPPPDRLRLPVLITEDRQALATEREPLADFVRQYYHLTPNGKTLKADFQNHWREWCLAEGHDSGNAIAIGKRLRQLTGGRVKTDDKAPDADGVRRNAYRGIERKT